MQRGDGAINQYLRIFARLCEFAEHSRETTGSG